ncbi:MAG: hypothetical protein M3Y13_15570, partial [Armatimonadota bacterium]|nr:hypothetical protein [Armatimonadota bacterium]
MAAQRLLLPVRGALQAVGIDRAVGFTLISRSWLALSGLVSVLLLTRFLNPFQQAFYFGFVDVLALQVFFELGLSTVILQFASHERAKLEWTPAGLLEGDPIAKSRLALLLRFSLVWYGVVAVLVALLLLPGGFLFFSRHQPPGVSLAWQLPWLWIVLVTAGSLALSPMISLLEGCGLVAEIAGVQLVQNMIGSVLFWLTLLCHWGLY